MTFRSAKLYRREGRTGFEAIGQLRPVVIIGSFEPVVAADCVSPETGNWRATQRPIPGQGHISLSSASVIALSFSFSLSLSPSPFLYRNDSSFTMTTVISRANPPPRRSAWIPKNQSPCRWTVPIGARERCTISICIGSPRHWNHNNNPDHSYRAPNGIKMSLSAPLHRLALEPALQLWIIAAYWHS